MDFDESKTKLDHDALINTPLDLASYTQEVQRFSCLLRPISRVYLDIQSLRRWRLPKVSLSCLIISNIFGFILTRGDIFLLASCLIFLVSALSLFHVHTRILDKVLPPTQLNTEECLILEDMAQDGGKSVTDFRVSLIQVYMFLMRLNRNLTRFFALLKWDDFKQSLRFYVTCGLFLLFLVIFPTRWNFIIATNWFLLSHKRVEKYVKRRCTEFVDKLTSQSATSALNTSNNLTDSMHSLLDQNGIAQQTGKQDAEKDFESIDRHAHIEETLSDLESDSSDSDALYPTSAPAENLPKRGVVSRLLDFKRRKQQMMTGSCHGCQATFTSILKRRYYCRHCGNHFCAKCCSQKVPRSVFGATSPAAKTETVLVCGNCYNTLVAKGLKIL